MSMSDPLNHLGSISHHPEPLEVLYSPNQFLGWDFFAISYSKPALGLTATNEGFLAVKCMHTKSLTLTFFLTESQPTSSLQPSVISSTNQDSKKAISTAKQRNDFLHFINHLVNI